MQKDLARGKKGEQLVLDLFIKNGHLAKCNDNVESRSFYDIEFSLLDKTYHIFYEGSIEVKTDEYAAKSGNIAIEYYNSKSQKAAGVTITRADLWVQIACGEIWFASVPELRKFIGATDPCRIIYGGGDGNADLLLYKKDRICNGQLFISADSLNSDDFTSMLINLLKVN